MRIKKSGWPTRIVIAAMMAYALCNIIAVQLQVRRAEAYRAELTAAVAALTKENEQLRRQIEQSDDPAVIEQVARARLGLVKPGEIIFYAD